MTLATGTKLGPYDILSPLGAGGMGEVYLANDSKLDRRVAIKVLPDTMTRDPERVARFQREAKVLASLNHPNIAAIYGFEVADEKNFLVMELVEGDTLSGRLKAGSMPVEEAQSVGKQMSEALEAAHERGVIHRDLKPANVIITPEGIVKVLDFGLAKAMGPADDRSQAEIANSPTITADFTRVGTILGTAAYMSPEQARGKPLDKRTDIWSFGCVLYECLGGRRPFEGETATDLIAKILERDPDWDSLPASTPPVVTALVQRCFRKDRRERLRDIGEAWVVLNGVLTGEASGLALTGYDAASQPSGLRQVLPWVLCALFACVFVASAWIFPNTIEPEARTPIQVSVELSPDRPLFLGAGAQYAFSPDGSRIAYVAGLPQERKLLLRRLDRMEPTELSGTIGAENPFFSPDGQWVAFFTDRHLKKISVSGGTPITLCAVDNDQRGGTWGIDGTIVFTPSTETGLFRVQSAGGAREELTQRVKGTERSHRWPRFTPDGQHILFTSQSPTDSFNSSTIEVLALDTMQRTVLHKGGSYPQLVPGGFLVFVREGTAYAVRVDAETWELLATPAPIIESVGFDPRTGGALFAFADNGTMAYSRRTLIAANSVVLIARDGTVTPLLSDWETYGAPRFSPDGKQLALQVLRKDSTLEDIWLYDIGRKIMGRLTFSDATDAQPVWSPDGQRIAFLSQRDGFSPQMYVRRADGSGEVERLQKSDNVQIPLAFTPDGKTLIYFEWNSETKADLWSMSMTEGVKPEPFLVTPFRENHAVMSPDGAWVAYNSNESGRDEIYLRPFPQAPGKWQISSNGGRNALWSPDGKELFYRDGKKIMIVSIDHSSGAPIPGRPTLLVDAPFGYDNGARNYDISPDGKRFVVVTDDRQSQQGKLSHLQFVFNWFSELESKVPNGKK